MTTLKNLKGTAIQFLDADPVVYVGTWASGGTMNTGRHGGGGSGAQTAAIVFGGQDPKRAQTETYDGTSFTEVNDMNTARAIFGNAGQGSQTATLAFGGDSGSITGATESWNGSTWTEVNDLNVARGYVSSFGTQTAAICANGYPPDTANVESWNGTSWTEVNNTPYAYSSGAGSGTQTSGLVFGGYYPPVGYNNASFEFDGTNWTSGGTMNTGRSNLEGAGTQTNTLIFGGQTAPVTGKSEAYDGTSFTEVADLSTVIHSSMPAGISGTAVLSAGGAPGNPTASEEFSFPGPTSSILNEGDMWFNSSSSVLKGYGTAAGVPAGTWSSGGNVNTARQQGAGVGPQTANLFFGGIKAGPARAPETEEYNGTAWTEKNDLNTARDSMAAGGTTTAAITAFGNGTPATPPITNIVELWDGTSWTETTDANSLRYSLGSAGTQTDLIAFGGYITAVSNLVETWDGTSWTEVTELNQAKSNIGSGGTSSTSALGFGGYVPGSPDHTANTEVWNGSSWTEVNNLNTSRYNVVGGGSVPGCLGTGGFTTTSVTNVETWNGTSWTEQSEIATNRFRGGGGGSVVAGIFSSGGNPPTLYTNTEEWTVDAVVSTITTS